ncbi:MAG TPA: PEP-CTERM sorting domain-containing protein [Bryobacteraceae bacterium]|jgi:PEP-CTERM motif-containing protein|nr:PEP-CTERM sorting domain-containing protein [Bryobacteraceae bacterium]
MEKYGAKVLALAAAVWMAPAGFGGMIVQPTAISSPQGSLNTPGYELTQIVNQSGLSAGYTSGVTDFATYLGSATHDSGTDPTINTGFTNTGGGFPQQITFNLGSVISIAGLGFWATSNAGTVTQFRLFTDIDGDPTNGVGVQLGGTFNALPNGGTAGPGQVFSFGATSTQFIHLYVDNTQLGTGAIPGIGEVAFDAAAQVPEPATTALVLMGLAGIALRRKR